MKRIKLRLALHTQNQDAVFFPAKVRKAGKHQLRRRKILRAARKHITRIQQTLRGHLAKEGQRHVVILRQCIAA